MSSTFSATLTDDREMIRSTPAGTTHIVRMGGLYAWIFVTLAIFGGAALLTGLEHGTGAAGDEGRGSQVDVARLSSP
jgi:hypothetical protein